MNFIVNNFRHLIKRFKTTSFLIIIGLSVAFAVFITVMIQLRYDFGFDRSFKNTEKIFKFSRYTPASGDEWKTMPQQLATEIKDKIPEVDAYCLIGDASSLEVTINSSSDKDNPKFNMTVVETTPGFIDVFSPEIILGDPRPDFTRKDIAVISVKTANKLFGNGNPIGKVLYVKTENKQQALTISSVYRDFPKNSSIQNAIYVYMEENTPNNWNYNGYFLFAPNKKEIVENKINTDDIMGEGTMEFFKKNPDQLTQFRLTPLKDMYLYSQGSGNNKRINTSLSLLAIGIIILVIAFINFVNFSIAMAPSRVRNINIHKILGIDKRLLRFVVMLEGVFLAFISFLLALVCLYFIEGTALINTFVSDFNLSANIGLIITSGICIFLVAFLAGIYPARYTTSFNEAFALSGSFTMTPVGVRLRNILITIQFISAIVLISISTFVKLQNDYMQNYDWGLQKENIVYLNIRDRKMDMKTIGEELKRNPDIKDYTLSRFIPGGVGMSWSRDFEGKFIDYFSSWPVAPNFLDFFGAKLIAGNNFAETTGDSTATEQIIFNQTFLDKNELGYDIIGKKFECFKTGIIRGVISDVNFESLHEPIKPMAFVVLDGNLSYKNYFFIKISANNTPQTIKYIETTWKKFQGGDFNLKFLDKEMDQLYQRENSLAKLIGFFGAISILISIMGIYGLILFNTRYKRKEIAIRKINGSSEWAVVLMLNKSLLTLLIVAFIIASPIAYFFAGRWFENFAYHISAYPWVFIVSGLLVALISVVTVSWQSWRAATANPVDALKNE